MKRRVYLLLLIAGVVLLFFFSGRYFYQKNLSEMHVLADSCLVHTLESELEKKQSQLDIPYSSFGIAAGTPGLTISMTTEEGTKTFKVDPEKSKKNISQSSIERGLYSIVCEESPLYPDSLSALWREALRARKMNVETSVQIAVTDFHEKVSQSASKDVTSAASLPSFVFTVYVGDRCEVEVRGIVYYSLRQVVWFHWIPFGGMIIVGIILFFLSYYLYRLANRPAKVKIIKEQVTREVVKLVKSTDLNAPDVYQLSPGFLLDVKRQVLIMENKEVKLPPQSCVILKLFLDAPRHTLTDDEILKGVWAEDAIVDIHRFSMAYSRVCRMLSKQGLFIKFKRVGSTKYRLILLGDDKDE